MEKKTIHVIGWTLLLVILGFIVLLPILKPGFLITDDGNWMVIRLSAFYQSLREGQFPVRFLGRLNQSYGYPVANFLYPGFLYIGSLLHIIGFSFSTSVEVIQIGSILIGAIALFFWLKHFFSTNASGIGAISFLFMPYVLYDVFKRGSVGEVLSIGMSTVVLYAIESKRHWLLSPAVALLAISHNTLALFFLPIFGAYILLKKYWTLIPSFIIGVGMSLFFWLPVFFERNVVLFNNVVISHPGDFFPVSNKLILYSVPFLIAAGVSLVSKTKKYKKEQWFFLALLGMGLFFATRASGFLWRIPDFVKFVQFPYRWLALWVFAGPWLIARLVNDGKKVTHRVVTAIFICTFVVLWIPYLKSDSVIQNEGFFTTNEGTTTVADEYMPKWASKKMDTRANKRVEFYSGAGDIRTIKVTTQTVNVELVVTEPSILQINTLYYPGWGAMLDNIKVPIIHDNSYGLMRVNVPAGTHHLLVEFRETVSRFMADGLSVAFGVLYFIALIASFVVLKKKKVNKQKK
ncbi:MAG: hypothetical protein V1917_01500 [Candidatus Gottesmanbacteria bacterium]